MIAKMITMINNNDKMIIMIMMTIAIMIIDHFTVVCSVTWPLNGSEAAGNLVLIQTSLLLLCKSSCSYAK